MSNLMHVLVTEGFIVLESSTSENLLASSQDTRLDWNEVQYEYVWRKSVTEWQKVPVKGGVGSYQVNTPLHLYAGVFKFIPSDLLLSDESPGTHLCLLFGIDSVEAIRDEI